MIKVIAIFIILIIAAILIFAATRPDTFRVQRRWSLKRRPKRFSRSSITFTRGKDGHRGKKLIPPSNAIIAVPTAA